MSIKTHAEIRDEASVSNKVMDRMLWLIEHRLMHIEHAILWQQHMHDTSIEHPEYSVDD
jgi:hypothetical protein